MLNPVSTNYHFAAFTDEIFNKTPSIAWIVDENRQQLFEKLEQDENFGIIVGYAYNTIHHAQPAPKDTLIMISSHIASVSDIKSDESRLVLFSGEEQEKAEKFVDENPDYQVIHSLPGGAILEMMQLFGINAGHLSSREQYFPWNTLATRLIDEASGDVTAFLDTPKPTSTFISKELPQIMENPNIPTINSVDKHRFKEFLDNSLDVIASPVFGINYKNKMELKR